MRRSRWLALALIAPTLLGACGGDEEPPSDEVRKPELTVPQDDTSGADATDESEPETGTGTDAGGDAPEEPMDQPNPGNGGVPAPDNNRPPEPPEPPDSPENDTPPEPGSPAERFEQFCAQNPGAC